MSDELVIRGKRGDFNDYEKFITKFKAAKTTDDCYAEIDRWQRDMARWAMRREIYARCDFKDYEPRKGFKCREYF